MLENNSTWRMKNERKAKVNSSSTYYVRRLKGQYWAPLVRLVITEQNSHEIYVLFAWRFVANHFVLTQPAQRHPVSAVLRSSEDWKMFFIKRILSPFLFLRIAHGALVPIVFAASSRSDSNRVLSLTLLPPCFPSTASCPP